MWKILVLSIALPLCGTPWEHREFFGSFPFSQLFCTCQGCQFTLSLLGVCCGCTKQLIPFISSQGEEPVPHLYSWVFVRPTPGAAPVCRADNWWQRRLYCLRNTYANKHNGLIGNTQRNLQRRHHKFLFLWIYGEIFHRYLWFPRCVVVTPLHRFAWRAPGADERGTLMGQPSVHTRMVMMEMAP